MNTYNRFPLTLVRGKGCWVWDETGKQYLDAVAGIATCTLGHSDPAMRRALSQQLSRLQHVSNLYRIPEQEALAQWIVDNSCGDGVFFCNSGAEANEAAIKLARKHGHQRRGIERPVILTAAASFHGRTLAAVTAAGQPNTVDSSRSLKASTISLTTTWTLFMRSTPRSTRTCRRNCADRTPAGRRWGQSRRQDLFSGAASPLRCQQDFADLRRSAGRDGTQRFMVGLNSLGSNPTRSPWPRDWVVVMPLGHLWCAPRPTCSSRAITPAHSAETHSWAGLTVGQEIERRNLLRNVQERVISFRSV